VERGQRGKESHDLPITANEKGKGRGGGVDGEKKKGKTSSKSHMIGFACIISTGCQKKRGDVYLRRGV